MVKIYEDQTARPAPNVGPHLIESAAAFSVKAMNGLTNGPNSPSLKGNGSQAVKRNNDLPGPNLDLVRELRDRLRAEWEASAAPAEIYSEAHYEDIMSPSSACTCWRYLLQRDRDPDSALELAKATLAWRKQNRIDELTARDMIKDFFLRAPIGLTGKTRSGNDLFYAIGKNFRKPDASIKQKIRDFIGFILFNWDRRHRDDLEQFEIVFDVSDTGFRNIDLEFSQWLVSIRDFVPARVKAIYFVGIPFLIRPVIRLIISWLPERFRRIAYCGTYDELVRANVDEEFIPEEIGGKSDSKWRLAPVDSKWIYEVEDTEENSREMFEKICKACNFNTSQELLDKLYQMQRDHDRETVAGSRPRHAIKRE